MNASRLRTWQALLAVSLIGLSWLAMMAAHELGHVLHAIASGGHVKRVVLHPLEISRTDVAPNPHPALVAWGGAAWGTLIPLALAAFVRLLAPKYAYLAKFFAGFCCVANGLYLAAAAIAPVGDAADLLRHGVKKWHLLLFGLPVTALGLWLWNGLGRARDFGIVDATIDRRAVVVLAVALATLVLVEVLLSPR